MTIADLDEVQYDLEADGETVRRQLARKIWEHRGWATVAVAYQERGAAGAWKPTKVALLRFRRMNEVWKKQAAITLALGEARELADTIASWAEDVAVGGSGLAGGEDDALGSGLSDDS